MRKLTGLLTAAILMVFASTASATTTVSSLTGDFSASNSTVFSTPEGVHFGTYADGGAIGGSLLYTGFNGHKLKKLTDFSYTFTYRQAGDTTGAAPYARVFLDDDPEVDSDGDGDPENDRNHDVILDPSYCATQTPEQAKDLTYQMVGDSVRYDDDGCDGVLPDNQPWADVADAHGSEVISALVISQGFSTGTDVSALLRNITVNGETFVFTTAGPVTIIQQVDDRSGEKATPVAGPSCKGNFLRQLKAQKRKGFRFISTSAMLRGKKLTVSGRKITVDLTNRAEGNYNVRIVTKYSKAGKISTVRTTRNLSVACA